MPGKAVRARKIKTDRVKRDPLYFDIKKGENPGVLSTKAVKKTEEDSMMHDDSHLEEQQQSSMIPQKQTQRILQLSREQQAEVQGEEGDSGEGMSEPAMRVAQRLVKAMEDRDDATTVGGGDDEELFYDEDGEDEEVEISAEDEAMLNKYMGDSMGGENLADMIMYKIQEAEEMARNAAGGNGMSQKVVEVYEQVGHHLSFYRSGKIPKAFKIIPTLKNWEQVLYLTRPNSWTAQATAVATRIFASNLKEKMAQRFYNVFLLPKIRADIDRHKKLNYHLMGALRKALYKPGAFFKGILLPLAQDECNAREALIISGLLRKFSVPALHGGVCLMKISEMPYSGPRFVLLKTLLNKKYSLPQKVINHLVDKFCQFQDDAREMPVIWHQTLLVLVQRYRSSISEGDREKLKALLRKHQHKLITPEIRRELAQCDTVMML